METYLVDIVLNLRLVDQLHIEEEIVIDRIDVIQLKDHAILLRPDIVVVRFGLPHLPAEFHHIRL